MRLLYAVSRLKVPFRKRVPHTFSHNVAAPSRSHLGRIQCRSDSEAKAYVEGYEGGARWALDAVRRGWSVDTVGLATDMLVRAVSTIESPRARRHDRRHDSVLEDVPEGEVW